MRIYVEACEPEHRETLIDYLKSRGAKDVRRSKRRPYAFTCNVCEACELLVDVRYAFPKEYYQGWTL